MELPGQNAPSAFRLRCGSSSWHASRNVGWKSAEPHSFVIAAHPSIETDAANPLPLDNISTQSSAAFAILAAPQMPVE
jgi:hypothetical protein